MVAFDPVQARETYADLDTEALVGIAYLEEDYLPEANEIARCELEKRGVKAEKDAGLFDRVRTEFDFRRRSGEMLAYENLEKSNRLEQKLTSAVLIGALWVFAFMSPTILADRDLKINWLALPLAIGWLIAAADALKKTRTGARRNLYLIILIPAALLLIGVGLSMTR